MTRRGSLHALALVSFFNLQACASGGMIFMPAGRGDFARRIRALHRELGIPLDYASCRGLELQPESRNLVETEKDVFDRQPLMDAEAFAAWQAMRLQAARDGAVLQIVSAYRSVEYQQGIFLRKMTEGQSLDDILKVNMAPGFSEHHSGCAVDITCPDFPPLSRQFEGSFAFAWLSRHGEDYGFALSYPKDNEAGVLYEPWHWRYRKSGHERQSLSDADLGASDAQTT